MADPQTPEGLKEHQQDYVDGAWQKYSLAELGQWVHLLAKRAGHRSTPEKRAKDMHDARNYLSMMETHLGSLPG